MSEASAEAQAVQFSATQKILHRAVVALIALQYLVFDHMGRPFHALMDGEPGAYTTTSIAHIVIGSGVLIAMLWRVSLRVMRGSPSHPEQEPGWAGSLAHLTHWIFYGLLVLLPVMGLLAWFGTLGEAAELHEIGTTILIGVMVVLLVSVSVHQLV